MGLPLVQYWHNEAIPEPIAGTLATFREHSPGLSQRVFNERTAAEFIEERYGPRHADAFRSCAVPAMQSDYFRFCSVHSLGGIYADANFACQKPLQPLLEPQGQLFEQPPAGPIIAGFFAFRSPGHPLLTICIEAATRNIERQISNFSGLMGGPSILTGLVMLHRGRPLEEMRGLVRPALRAEVDACIGEAMESLRIGIEKHGSLESAFDGVSISSRDEMLTWVKKPHMEFKNPGRHWGRWKGSAYRTTLSRNTQ